MSRLSVEQLKLYVNKAPGWVLTENPPALHRTFVWGGVPEAIRFVTRVAELLEAERREPDLRIAGPRVTVTLSNGTSEGLTGREIALAQAINKLL